MNLTPPNPDAPAIVAAADIYPSEDAAIAAFRFAETYSFFSSTDLLDIMARLTADLPPTYTPPAELTHCGKKACTAGKLYKRAEESRKAEMHDAAGADLLRAMTKSGLETDFVDKCKAALDRAFDSVKRQREREAREAEEERKLQQRLAEEAEAMEAAAQRKQAYDAAWESIVRNLPTAAEASINPDGSANPVAQHMPAIVAAFTAADYDQALALIKKIPGNSKTVEIWLIEARSHEVLQNFNSALSAAGNLIQKHASHDAWSSDSPRMLAVTLGANAAMQLGLSDKALKFYQSVLKFDPDQPVARKQYRGLKKVIKALDNAEDQIQKGYNKAANGHIDDCLSALKGLDVDSPLFRSKIQLKLCTILSNMAKHEEALAQCDSAVSVRSVEGVSDSSRQEAFLSRGEALLLDDDFDGAVSDFRSAFDLVPDDARERKMELNQKLQHTMRLAEDWNGGKKDHYFNEHRGFPNGKPPQRDNIKILQLPVNLNEHSKEIKCSWLKKQFKALVRKYHPDKYQGKKDRANRKFKEVTDAKEALGKEWEC
jgi:tetratricopeptide (TPR) repeat protein